MILKDRKELLKYSTAGKNINLLLRASNVKVGRVYSELED